MKSSRFKPMRMRASRNGAAPFARRLVVMVKEPVAGRVKTRLARDIGIVAATFFYRHTVMAVLRRVVDPRCWESYLAVAPSTAVASRSWQTSAPRLAQTRGDLGQRMHHIMSVLPPGPTIIIGTDIPGIQQRHIAQAFARLRGSDAVFGPAEDGGYWLVGLTRRPRLVRVFDNVRWSTAHALTDTVANLYPLTTRFVSRLSDVDRKTDHSGQHEQAGRVIRRMTQTK